MLSKLINKFVIYLFIIGPLIAFSFWKYLNVSYNNAMSAFVYFGFAFLLVDYINAKKKTQIPRYIKYFILFTIYTIVSDILINDVSINIKYMYTHRTISSALVLILIYNTEFSKKDIKFIIRISSVILFFALFVIIYQEIINAEFLVNKDYSLYDELFLEETQTRLPSIFTWIHPITIGYYVIPVLAILISLSLINKDQKYILFFIIGFIFIFLIRARWIMLNYLLLFIMIQLYKKIIFKHLVKNVVLIFIVVIISYNALNLINVPVKSIIEERILEKPKGGLLYGSASTRLLAFQVFGKLFPINPIFGNGHSLKISRGGHDRKLDAAIGDRSSQIHVGYLSLFYWYGLIGGILYLLFLFYMMRHLYINAKRTKFWGSFFGMLCFVVGNLTHVYLAPFEIGLILCLVFDRYFEQKYTIEYNNGLKVIRN